MAEYEGRKLGNYRLIRQLGRGGFSHVYLGEHIYLKTQAAIKVVNTRLTDESLQSFLHEARTIAHLIHPHIVRVLEFDVEKDVLFFVMDYAPNGTLRNRHPKGTRVTPVEVASYISQVAEALQYAHDQSLIHRDIKPENMLIGQNGEILLSDFGVAIASQTQNSLVSAAQDVVGTVAYMAPEQLMGKAQRASDQYALGIVVYEWLCGERPFQGSFPEICQQHLSYTPVPLRVKIPTIPQYLDDVILRTLEKKPQNRFMSVKEFADALQQACEPTLTRIMNDDDENSTVPVSLFDEPAQKPQHQDDVEASRMDSTIQPNASAQKHLPQTQQSLQLPYELTETAFPFIPAHFKNLTPPEAVEHLNNAPASTSFVDELLDKPPASSFLIEPVDNTVEMTFATRPMLKSLPGIPGVAPTITGITAPPIICRGHSDWIRAVAWSPDGKVIASASNDRTINLWNADTGRRLTTLRGHARAVYSLVWSPDGKSIASAGADKTIIVWDVTTGRRMYTCQGHSGEICSLTRSPDGEKIASASTDKSIQVWHTNSGRKAFTCLAHTDWVRAVTWSPDGKNIASAGNDKKIVLWDAHSGSKQSSWKGHTHWVRAIQWSPDGQYIASAGDDKTVLVWDVAVGQKIRTYTGHTACWLGGVLAVSWSPDGQWLASAGEDQTVQIWNVLSGTDASFTYTHHTAPVDAVAWSPDGRSIASAGHDKLLEIWKVS